MTFNHRDDYERELDREGMVVVYAVFAVVLVVVSAVVWWL